VSERKSRGEGLSEVVANDALSLRAGEVKGEGNFTVVGEGGGVGRVHRDVTMGDDKIVMKGNGKDAVERLSNTFGRWNSSVSVETGKQRIPRNGQCD